MHLSIVAPAPCQAAGRRLYLVCPWRKLCSLNPITHYCIVRDDLPIGAKAAQLVHAAGYSAHDPPEGTYAVVLAVPHERALLRLHQQLEFSSIPHVLIREPDMDDQATAIGVVPCPRDQVRRLLSRLPLLR